MKALLFIALCAFCFALARAETICQADTDCPRGFFCSEKTNLCVPHTRPIPRAASVAESVPESTLCKTNADCPIGQWCLVAQDSDSGICRPLHTPIPSGQDKVCDTHSYNPCGYGMFCWPVPGTTVGLCKPNGFTGYHH